MTAASIVPGGKSATVGVFVQLSVAKAAGKALFCSSLRESQWLHEREWRVPNEFRFAWHDVKFLIVPHAGWQAFYASWIESWAGSEYAVVFESIPAVVMEPSGKILRDDSGIWS